MGQQVLAVRIGDKYGQEYEDYLNNKIDNITWIREPFDPRVKLQWNKLVGMSLDIDEPIVVLDIDILLLHNYMDMINYPIERGEFVAFSPWWSEIPDQKYKMQGGFQKYYPKDCRYIFDKFMSDPEYYQEYYIKNKTTIGPVNGEQFFVEDSVNERLTMKFVPQTWMGPMVNEPTREYLAYMDFKYPGDWYYLDEFNPDIKMVHFTHQENRQYPFQKLYDKAQAL